ncbi:MAG: transposase [Candidatus Aenigmarchaeota archaeon]|nr:transposase [Candidatus Aenigmarchaeota archaeon]
MELFNFLLKNLVQCVEEPEQKIGRPRLRLGESLFCTIGKVYSQLSSRRAHTLYREAKEKGQIDKAPNFNAINKFLNREDITPLLHKLLVLSALPLKGLESTFALDSSGFRTNQFTQYAVQKYNAKKEHKWIKAHIMCGTKTNVIVSVRITKNNAGDSPQFAPLVKETYENGFEIKRIVADRAYSSRDNYNLAEKIGAEAYIPFKPNATGTSKGSLMWKKMYHYFQLNQEKFMEHYHARSNVETTFMMVKTKFGDKLKSKSWISQQNELLCKFIAHNICVIIQEMMELGINHILKQ